MKVAEYKLGCVMKFILTGKAWSDQLRSITESMMLERILIFASRGGNGCSEAGVFVTRGRTVNVN